MSATVGVEMTEGEKLQKLLDRHGRTQADLARAMDITRGAVHHYVLAEKWEKRRWMNLRAGLAKLGINPLELRPSDIQAEPPPDLTLLIEKWDRDHLEALREILMASEPSRATVLAFVNGALRHIRIIK